MKTFYSGQLIEYKAEGRHGSWYCARYVRTSEQTGWHWIAQDQIKRELEVPTRRLRAMIRWEANR